MAEIKKQSGNTRSVNNGASKETVEKVLEIPHNISVRQLSEMLKVTVVDIIKQLMRIGIMANINQVIDFEVAEKVAAYYGYKAQLKAQTARKSASVISEIKKTATASDYRRQFKAASSCNYYNGTCRPWKDTVAGCHQANQCDGFRSRRYYAAYRRLPG